MAQSAPLCAKPPIDGLPQHSYITNRLVINTVYPLSTSSPPGKLPALTQPLPDGAGLNARRTRRKDARPGELLDAALELLSTKGYAATRVEEVARKAGVSKGTLFLYFPSKEELFKAVVRHALADRFAEWDVELSEYALDTAALIHYTYQTWWERVGSTQASGLTNLIMAEANNFPEIAAFYRQEVVLPGNRLLERVLERGIARGEIRPLDVAYGATVLVAPLVFCAMSLRVGSVCVPIPDLDVPRFLQLQAEVLVRGLAPDNAPLPPKGAQP